MVALLCVPSRSRSLLTIFISLHPLPSPASTSAAKGFIFIPQFGRPFVSLVVRTFHPFLLVVPLTFILDTSATTVAVALHHQPDCSSLAGEAYFAKLAALGTSQIELRSHPIDNSIPHLLFLGKRRYIAGHNTLPALNSSEAILAVFHPGSSIDRAASLARAV